MSDKNPNKVAVMAVIEQLDSDFSMSELLAKVDVQYAPRTLRRWLSEWVQLGVLERTGEKRAVRYELINKLAKQTVAQIMDRQLVFSDAAKASIEQVRQSVIHRNPVGYQPNLLEQYQPNTTSYLSEEELAVLEGCQPKAGVLPAGTFARHIYNRLMIDLSYYSSRLEGNTYSLADTEKLVLSGVGVSDKLDEERVMIINHKEAIRFLIEHAHDIKPSTSHIQTLHYLLSDGLVAANRSGKLRQEGVRIGYSTYLPLENGTRLQQTFETLCDKALAIQNPFEQSLFLHVHIAYLQAFIDVNKRTARLCANIPFIKHNLIPMAFNDVEQQDYSSAMLAFYELHDVMPIKELMLFSYQRSAKQYQAITDNMVINTTRVRYRDLRRQLLGEIIRSNLLADKMQETIEDFVTQYVPSHEARSFKQDVNDDLRLMSLERSVGLGVSKLQVTNWLVNHANT